MLAASVPGATKQQYYTAVCCRCCCCTCGVCLCRGPYVRMIYCCCIIYIYGFIFSPGKAITAAQARLPLFRKVFACCCFFHCYSVAPLTTPISIVYKCSTHIIPIMHFYCSTAAEYLWYRACRIIYTYIYSIITATTTTTAVDYL